MKIAEKSFIRSKEPLCPSDLFPTKVVEISTITIIGVFYFFQCLVRDDQFLLAQPTQGFPPNKACDVVKAATLCDRIAQGRYTSFED